MFELVKLLKNRLADDKIRHLGIPEQEMTESVSTAVNKLLTQLDGVSRELERTKEALNEVEKLVDIDEVTDVPNRRAFMRRLSWVISMHKRYGHPSSILYFDLNDFKIVNDTYGHATGDMAIRHVSQILQHNLRESDFLARIGGDEFALIMYYAQKQDAMIRGQHIADTVRQSPFMYNGRPVNLSIACGVYALRKGDDVESALAAADKAMYADKKQAREIATNISA